MGLSSGFVNSQDLLQERFIPQRMGRRWSRTPRVVAAGGDLENATHGLYAGIVAAKNGRGAKRQGADRE